jgi:phage gp36-like protein
VPSVPTAATVADFVIAFTMIETIELSNLDSGGSSVDCTRINKALLDAYKLLTSCKVLLMPAAAAVVDANLNRWMLVIARYYLDTIRRRADVLADYKTVMDLLDKLSGASTVTASQMPHQIRNHNGKTAVYTQTSLANFVKKSSGIS